MEKTYLVFVIFGFEMQTTEGQFMQSTEMQLIAGSPEEALKKAKSLVKKKFYYIKTVIEKYKNE